MSDSKEHTSARAGEEHTQPGSILSADPYRPGYHFLPSANWLNDPNGLMHWKGVYHLFYQYNPHSSLWGDIHWGHATSTDLVHWTHLPLALAPDPNSPDQDGCWSGCAINNNGVPTLIYTCVRDGAERPCLATSVDDLLTWQKYPRNPVIAAPPPGFDIVGFRDHCVWKEGDTWFQLIGSGIKDVGGTAFLYSSLDLLHWQFVHPLLVGNTSLASLATASLPTGFMWECPDLFSLDSSDRRVLALSIMDTEQGTFPAYFTGTYSRLDHTFTPAHLNRLDFGPSFYAPQSMIDDTGRRLMWGWLREERSDLAQKEAGWSGTMSLPRVLSLGADGSLMTRPAPELAMLRRNHLSLADISLNSNSAEQLSPLNDIQSDMLEIIAEVELMDASELGIAVRRSPDQSEQTLVLYDCAAQQLVVDTSHSSLSDMVRVGRFSGDLSLAHGENLRIRLFVDRSIVEVFGNDKTCVTSRVYPTRTDSLGIALFAYGGTARLVSLDVWEMASNW